MMHIRIQNYNIMCCAVQEINAEIPSNGTRYSRVVMHGEVPGLDVTMPVLSYTATMDNLHC